MPVFSKRRWLNVLVVALLTILTIATGVFFATRDPPDIRSFLAIRDKWDRTTPKQGEKALAESCLALANEYPDAKGGLAALYMAARRAATTEPGKKAHEMFIRRIADADLGRLACAMRYSDAREFFILESPPDPGALGYYYRSYKDGEIATAILDRMKRNPNDPQAAVWLTRVCEMSKGDRDDEEPRAIFAEAAELIVSQHAGSPDIDNFCESLGGYNGSPLWARRYEPQLRKILQANQNRFIRCAAQFALASVVQSWGESRQAEAEELYKEFLEKFDGKFKYPYQRVEQGYREYVERQLKEIDLCGFGKPAPEIVGADLDGQPMKLSDFRGKVVLVSFWATWCGPCMKLVPHERDVAMRLDGKPFALIGINADTDEKTLQEAVAKQKITWRSFQDLQAGGSRISEKWHILGWPTLYLIDHEGVIRDRWCGAPRPDVLDRAIDNLVDKAPQNVELRGYKEE